jgi:demethylmenaquinone methyltransferase/2-methoxy-6-polyprenyl-1,4-benzoquinol methylase
MYLCQKLKMPKHIRPYSDSKQSKKQQVESMFDNISGNYDRLNRVISLGIDQSWRKKVIKKVINHQPKTVLDVATGTGDLVVALAASSAEELIGLDLSKGMLDTGQQKIKQKKLDSKIKMQQGDAEAIPYDNNYFDAITVAFGVRNFENLEKGLQEMCRVLKPGGLVVILETAVPTKFPFKQFYTLYSRNILPLIGKIFSKDKSAYNYLSESAAVFPYGKEFNNILKKSGFKQVEDLSQTFGVASIYTATK